MIKDDSDFRLNSSFGISPETQKGIKGYKKVVLKKFLSSTLGK
jgi:hypothetical protein